LNNKEWCEERNLHYCTQEFGDTGGWDCCEEEDGTLSLHMAWAFGSKPVNYCPICGEESVAHAKEYEQKLSLFIEKAHSIVS